MWNSFKTFIKKKKKSYSSQHIMMKSSRLGKDYKNIK